MPAAQGEVSNREIRFTLRFRRTVTIAARSVSSSFVTGQAAARRAMTVPAGQSGVEQLLEFAACRITNSRAMTRPEQPAGAEQPTPANDQYGVREDFSAGRLVRGLSERSGQCGRSGNEDVPGERGRRRTRQDQISCRALARRNCGLKDTRTERRKPVSSAGPVLKERTSLERTLFRNTIQPLT